MFCQILQGPERIEQSELLLPQGVKVQNTGIDFKTPVMRVIAVGPECKFVKAGDQILMSPNVTIYETWFDGDRGHVVHEDGIYGVLDQEHRIGEKREHAATNATDDPGA